MIDFSKIQDKQRILIIGTDGTAEITKIAAHVLETIDKPFDYYVDEGNSSVGSTAPVILIGVDQASHTTDELLAYRHHVAVFHHIKNQENKQAFDDEFDHYEVLADKTPKGGTIIYNSEDNLATVVSTQKDREDVRLLEYSSLRGKKTNSGFMLEDGTEIKTNNKHFGSLAGAAKELLMRIRVQENQFLDALKTYKEA